jgi:anti-sigma regulatory factor (Ser/Thr protein kinase)
MEAVTLPASLDSLQSIGRYVLDAAERAGLDRLRAYRLRLAVDELATNIITHGSELGSASPVIGLSARVADDALTIALEDSGPAYDPLQAPRPDHLDRPLEQRTIGGLGVYLAVRSVDRFEYERIDGRNRHLLTMARPSSPSAAPA